MDIKEKIVEVLQGVLLMADGVSEEELKDLLTPSAASKANYIYNFLNSYLPNE